MEECIGDRGIKKLNAVLQRESEDDKSTPSTFAVLPVELFIIIFEYFSLTEILHSFFNVTRRLNSLILDGQIQFRDACLSKNNPYLPPVDTKQIISLKLENVYNVHLVPSFIHLKSLTIDIDYLYGREQLDRITEELPSLTCLISLQTTLANFQLIAAAFAHPHLRRFILTSSLSTCPPQLPASHSLRYIGVPYFNLSTVAKYLSQARFLDIASFDHLVLPNLICPHLRMLRLHARQTKAKGVCCLFNSNAFPSLKEIELYGNIDRDTEMKLFEFDTTFFPLLSKFKKVILGIVITAYRMYIDPTRDIFCEFIEIKRERGNRKKLHVKLGSEFPQLWYDLEGLRDKMTKT